MLQHKDNEKLLDNSDGQLTKLAICWIGIGSYNVLFDDFYKSYSENFCAECEKTFFIFTDRPWLYKSLKNVLVYTISHAQTHKGFVLFRKFKYLLMAEDQFLNFDYVAFINGNMVCNKNITLKDILRDRTCITAATHPCINNAEYVQAGFFIANSIEFLKLANTIEGWRHLDKALGKDSEIPCHDETYFNRYYQQNLSKFNVLDGKAWLCPGDLMNTGDSMMYTRNKKTILGKKFVPTESPDLYNINENFRNITVSEILKYSFVITVNGPQYDMFSKIFTKNGLLPLPQKYVGIRFSNSEHDITIKPEAGCSAAHVSIVRLAKYLNWPFVCVFEDDAYPCYDIVKKLELYFNNRPDNIHLLILGNSDIIGNGVITVNDTVFISASSVCGSHAYILFNAGYDEYIDKFNSEEFLADSIVKRLSNKYSCNMNLFIQYNINNSMHYAANNYLWFGRKEDDILKEFPPINKYD